jgi:type II secretory pathway predicted ATPase ExeA
VYEKFFGFTRPPFELLPDPDFLFLGESHDSALAHLLLGIEAGKGFVVITGAIGTGKTTLLRALLRRIGRTEDICFLYQPDFDATQLLRAILEDNGVAARGWDKVECRRALDELLRSRERPLVLIVDEAHLLTEGALEQIRLLSNYEEDNRKLLQIVLAGQPELLEVLARPRLRPLAQRIEMFYEIEPLKPEETGAYINRRVEVAGNPDGLVFEPRAVAAIHRHSGGVPRLINTLSDRCLITAYVSETRRITPRIVSEAFADLGKVARAVMDGPATAQPAAATPKQPFDGAVDPESYLVEPGDLLEVVYVGRGSAASRWEVPGRPEPRREPRPPAPLAPEPALEAGVPVASASAWPQERVSRWLAGAALLALIAVATGSLTTGAPEPQPKRSRAAVSAALPTLRLTERDSAEASRAAQPAVALVSAVEPAVDSLTTAAARVAVDDTTHTVALQLATASAPEPPSEFFYVVHAASFRQQERARAYGKTLEERTGEVLRVVAADIASGHWHRILLGDFPTRDAANERAAELEGQFGLKELRTLRLRRSPENDPTDDSMIARGAGE